jgi:hypothetical protein
MRIIAFVFLISIAAAAQSGGGLAVTISETAGIRRTEYPVNARVEMPRGSLRSPADAALRYDETEIPAQFTGETTWPDGSVRALQIDFNASLAPLESRTYQLAAAGGERPTAARGLSVSETDSTIQVGNVRFGKSGAPLMLSANYVKSEFIGKGPSGFAVISESGKRTDLSAAHDLKVEIPKRGPLNVVVKYSGELALTAAERLPFVIHAEMPNSKSWVKMSAAIHDPRRSARAIVFDAPLAFASLPLTWDFGTPNSTYGVFRTANDVAVLTQTVTGKGPSEWTVQTGTSATLQPYERSTAGHPPVVNGWGHLLDGRGAVAFAIDQFAAAAGTYSITLNGQGHASFSFAPREAAREHRLVVYQHFVSVPVPIGAATNPAAMLNPVRVALKR